MDALLHMLSRFKLTRTLKSYGIPNSSNHYNESALYIASYTWYRRFSQLAALLFLVRVDCGSGAARAAGRLSNGFGNGGGGDAGPAVRTTGV